MNPLGECGECGVQPYAVVHGDKLALRCDCSYLAVGGPAYLREMPDTWPESEE